MMWLANKTIDCCFRLFFIQIVGFCDFVPEAEFHDFVHFRPKNEFVRPLDICCGNKTMDMWPVWYSTV